MMGGWLWNQLNIIFLKNELNNILDGTVFARKSQDVINLMKLGEMNRTVGSTITNIRSSRSHSVLTIHVHGKDISESTLNSCLHMEKIYLFFLCHKGRFCSLNSLFSQYAHCSFMAGGNAKTLMFAHVSPEGKSFCETMSTLKFAQRVSAVELGVAHANKESNEVLDLKLQIENLRRALANKELRTPRTTKPEKAIISPLPKQMAKANTKGGTKNMKNLWLH